MRIVGFGDAYGMHLLLKYLQVDSLVGIVGAEIRPQYWQPLKELAGLLAIPFLIQPKFASPKYPYFVSALTSLEPDYIIVHSYSMKLHQDVLDIPRQAAVNVHGALLPQYRGANPIQWALLNGETETGVTMHYMDASFDTGDIIAQRRVPIYFDDTWCSVQSRIGQATEHLLAEELPRLFAGAILRHPQNAAHGRNWPRRRPEDGQFDWGRNVISIYNLIRALVDPHPGAFYLDANGEKVVLRAYLTLPQVIALKYGSVGRVQLSTEHIILAPLAQADLDFLLGFNLDSEERTRLIEGPIGPAVDWLANLLSYKDRVYFAIRRADSSELAGLVSIVDLSFVHNKARMQIAFSPGDHLLASYLNDVLRIMLRFVFDELGLSQLYTHIPDESIATIRGVESVGFTREGRLRRTADTTSTYDDLVVLSLLRENYDS